MCVRVFQRQAQEDGCIERGNRGLLDNLDCVVVEAEKYQGKINNWGIL